MVCVSQKKGTNTLNCLATKKKSSPLPFPPKNHPKIPTPLTHLFCPVAATREREREREEKKAKGKKEKKGKENYKRQQK
jgi:hypothetical protein